MKSDRKGPSKHRRAGVIALGAAALLIVSYIVSLALHAAAVRQLEAARAHITRDEWLAAIRCLDRAQWEDPFLIDSYLLRATAINGHVSASELTDRTYSRRDALVDIDWYLRFRPDSGEAHYERGISLGLGKAETARQELALAIPLLKDPTDALVDRAALSFHVDDHETAVKEITAAIQRRPLVPEYYDARLIYRRFLHDFRGARADEIRAALLRESKDLSAVELEARAKALLDYTPISEPQDSPAVAAERARFMGRWQVLARESGGESLDMTDRDFSITFGADRYRLVIDGRTRQDGTFTLDPKRQPHRIDWTARIDGKEHRVLGLYEFRGETLKLCMANAGEPRPAKLPTAGLDYVVLYTLRRSARSGSAANPVDLPGKND